MLTHLGLDVWKPELGGCENAGGTAQYTMETDELITKAGGKAEDFTLIDRSLTITKQPIPRPKN